MIQTTSARLADRLAEDCREALAAVEHALELAPKEAQEKMGIAKRAIVRLRDDLIAQLRAAESPHQRAPIRQILDRVNVALSLVIGVEYPAAGVQRTPVEQASDLLKGLVD